MNEERGTIANLHVRSNLMSNDYQNEFRNISVFELADIKRRNPLLPISLNPSFYDYVTSDQQRQWNAHLFWGDKRVRMTETRRLRWLEAQALGLFAAFDTIEERLAEEQAFEILYFTEQLRRTSSNLAIQSTQISSRVVEILRGEVFGHSVSTIEQRLAAIAGEPGFRLERPNGNRTNQDRP
ncbi:hypothetical protein ACYOEI_21625 [Singulisphaera rosea]